MIFTLNVQIYSIFDRMHTLDYNPGFATIIYVCRLEMIYNNNNNNLYYINYSQRLTS